MMIKALLPVLIFIICLFFWWHKESPFRWIVYYGTELREQDLKGIDLAIVQPGAVDPQKFKNRQTKLIAYLSVGEAETSREDWPEVSGKTWVIEPNPDWPGSYRVDIRSKEWQELLLKRRIPKILEEGFDGLFLDTIDLPLYLEESDPKKYSGSKETLLQWVRTLRSQYPKILLFPNNALGLLEDYGEIIDGVVVEDLYT
ncbi:MAG: endo alpha-1,4 polygalactosaminidase, partial [Deltaproteobacteria bacterium]|nr:endo alpha-1,4 polygalactosaminidase [Deltaproteobacteria bacterium]